VIWTSVLASNAPDLDFVTRAFAHDRQLAYLLQHRGYTHTVLLALPIGALLAAGCSLLLRVRGGEWSRVLGAGALAALLHVAFDALNNYGVHPFFPFDNRWYYGDAVFIVEPLLLAVLLPLLAHRSTPLGGRVLGFSLCALLLGLVWYLGFMPRGVAIATSATLSCAWLLQQRAGASARPALWGAALIVCVFAVGAWRARNALTEQLGRLAPGERIAQLVTTPFPGNPLCWAGLLVTTDAAGNYRARFAGLSLAPALVRREACAFMPRGKPTAPLQRSTLAPDSALRFTAEFRAPLQQLRALRREHCDADAALHFLRVPYWTDGRRPVLGDLRYDNEPGLEFAERALNGDCRDAVPPWVPPLSALLSR
jgi:inner membrane protein